MRIEIRRGFADADGELLAVLDRPGWQRITPRRTRQLVDELMRVCAASRAREVEAWHAAPRGRMRHIIGYWP
jgi:hypothetical protein